MDSSTVDLPKVRNVWIAPKKGSRRYALCKKMAPAPSKIRFYPDLPYIDDWVWAIWRKGQVGVAEYMGGWTYRTATGLYINDMPIAWHPVENPELSATPATKKRTNHETGARNAGLV
jgi:hypothetical protein